MTREEAIKIIQNEYKCVDRECDIEKSCGKCPYMMPTKEPILKAYEMAIQALSQEPTIRPSFSYTAEIKADDEQLERLQGILNGEMVVRLEQEPICDRDCEHRTWTECPIEPCDDAISRDAVVYYIKAHINEIITESGTDKNAHTNAILRALINGVETMPSVTQKSKTGHWFAWKPEDDVWRTTCSECGEETRTLWNYCPHCGAKMVEPQESEDKE